MDNIRSNFEEVPNVSVVRFHVLSELLSKKSSVINIYKSSDDMFCIANFTDVCCWRTDTYINKNFTYDDIMNAFYDFCHLQSVENIRVQSEFISISGEEFDGLAGNFLFVFAKDPKGLERITIYLNKSNSDEPTKKDESKDHE